MRIIALSCCLLLGLASCAGETSTEELSLEPVAFSELPGWILDHQADAAAALSRSCPRIEKKSTDWKLVCQGLSVVAPGDDGAARAFFETYFQPYIASGRAGDEGLFTGYYEAELRGSLHKSKKYHVPLYQHPNDLVTVDLGQFRPTWKGEKIAGKVAQGHLVPYDDRAAIEVHSLKGRAKVLVWVDDPVDAFFLEIQGSGRVRLPNGRILRIGYESANGRSYTAVGRVLAELNELQKPVTMQSIRAWFASHPNRAQEIMNRNASYVFFRKLPDGDDGPLGAEGVALTPLRSLAVDPAFVRLGTPIWLATKDPGGVPLERLVVAQDTGGAIKGPVRGDLFWGAGNDAEQAAGAMQSRGHYYLLLPRNAPNDDQ